MNESNPVDAIEMAASSEMNRRADPLRQPLHAAAPRSARVLPTLQMNVLRKHFDRFDVAPDEVAALDYAALMRLPGIGRRGIEIVRIWLRAHGLDVANPPAATRGDRRGELKRKRIEQAITLLRNNGFVVEKARE